MNESSAQRLGFLAAALLLCPTLMAEGTSGYARPELLAEVRDLLANREGDRARFSPHGVTVLDVRSNEWHAAGNLMPGWRIDIAEWKEAFQDGADALTWSTRIASVLTHPDATVIVYDETVTPNAAQTWWILKYWGVEDVRILNGGMKAWRAAGGKAYPFAARRNTPPAAFVARPHLERLAAASEVFECLRNNDSPACLIDARGAQEVQAGFIPTARHSDWANYVDADTGKMRSAEQLQALLDEAGFEQDRAAIAYCHLGARASVVAFAMELMGAAQAANYYGGWSEWRQLPGAPTTKP